MQDRLSTMRVQLEQYYQDNRTYGSTATVCGNGIGAEVGDAFTYTCTNGGGNAQNFLITATGNAGTGMSGFTFTVDETNTRRTTAFPDATGLPKACWITKAGDAC
jgi:type IV pilus assembly protein PilE